ncbi:MAG TPA: type II secretion system protein [Clostridiales bacterium]|nr:type II secretion system protein [Clostridiales bacterium]
MWFAKNKGFTLVELMIVVVIMAILVTVAVPVYMAVADNAEKRTCNNNCKSTSAILTHYMNGIMSDDGLPKSIPDFEIHNEGGSPVFYSPGGGAPTAEISDLGSWLLTKYQDTESACCIGDGIISVTVVTSGNGAFVSVICSEHS